MLGPELSRLPRERRGTVSKAQRENSHADSCLDQSYDFGDQPTGVKALPGGAGRADVSTLPCFFSSGTKMAVLMEESM